MRTIYLAVLLLATSVLGSPVITSLSPSEGPVAGGTKVLIHGTGFNDNCIICSPPFANPIVSFGTVEAADVRLIEPTLLEVTTPAHVAGTVDVTVEQLDGSDPNHFTLEDGFTFVDDPPAGYEPILFPIFMPPVQGAYGSEFRTDARLVARGAPVDVYGIDLGCTLLDPPIGPRNLFRVGSTEMALPTTCAQTVGRIFYVAPGEGNKVAASLRVSDVTRQAESHGVEIPVVRRADFSHENIVLLNVPIDRRYRNTLRVYGLHPGYYNVRVTFNGETHDVPLVPGDIFSPAYGSFTDFPLPEELPRGQDSIKVTIGVARGADGQPLPNAPLWAFISVTNNDTQHITTITPN